MSDGEVMANPEFEYVFNSVSYKIKKATIRQVIEWQKKVMEITKDNTGGADLQTLVAALFIILYGVDKNITEDYILDNALGDMDVMNNFQILGFMSQQKMKVLNSLKNVLASQPSGIESTT